MKQTVKSPSIPTILIIEDEMAILDILTKTLEAEGYRVLPAENGQRGLQQAIQHKPQLIVLDVMLPKMDGIEVLEQLRQHPWGKTAKVVMLSNNGDQHKVLRAHQLAAVTYLIKADFDLADIIKKIKAAL